LKLPGVVLFVTSCQHSLHLTSIDHAAYAVLAWPE